MRFVLLEELRIGWFPLALVSVGLVLLGLRLEHAPIAFVSPRLDGAITCGIATVLGLSFGAWHVQREQQAPDFLASRRVGYAGLLTAKLLASAIDVLAFAPGLVLLCGVLYDHRSEGVVEVTIAVAFGSAVMAVATTWTAASRWISGTACAVFGVATTYLGSEALGHLDREHWVSPEMAVWALAVVGTVLAAFARRRAR